MRLFRLATGARTLHDGRVTRRYGTIVAVVKFSGAFDPFDEVLMSLFANSASQAITNARRWHPHQRNVSVRVVTATPAPAHRWR